MDITDRKLLTLIQNDVPLIPSPFEEIGRKVGTSEADVIARLGTLKDELILRQISAIFDTRSLGYKSTLVAMKYPREKVDEAADVINEHPGVSHNYKRSADYNLWFTVAVPPTDSLEETVDLLGKLSGAESYHILPTLYLYKIGVKLNLTPEKDMSKQSADEIYDEEKRPQAMALTEREIELIRILQEDLPLVPKPFEIWAVQAGLTERELLEEARRFIERGFMRRFSAVLHHRNAGFRANDMVVWAIPKEQIHEVGQKFARYREISHCYERPVFSDWPYSVYTMIHGTNAPDCENVVTRMIGEIGDFPKLHLYSTKEYKKIRLKYFTDDLHTWWAKNSEKGKALTPSAPL